METTLYKKEPVSVKPETTGYYMTTSGTRFYDSEKSEWRYLERTSGTSDLDFFWLKPVSVSEVPDDTTIKLELDKLSISNDAPQIKVDGAIWMRDQLLPHFALLKEENEKQAEKIRKETDFVEQLKDAIEVEKEENKKLKARVSELEGEKLSTKEMDLTRQWFDHIQDTSDEYLGREDFRLAERLYEILKMRVPHSIIQGAGM